MATLVKTVADFTIVSTWEGSYFGGDVLYYGNSTTITKNKTYSLEGLLADAILDSAILESVLNSPYSGVAIRRVDDVAFNGSKDVLAKLQALNGNYAAGVEFAYKFKAKGNTGGEGSHSSTQQFYDNILTIVYHMPNSLLTLDPASEVAAGATVTAYIEAGSAEYTHRVAYAIGSHNGYVDATAGQTQKTFAFPLSWLDAVPNGTSVQGTVVLYTYSGTTLLGTDVKYITVTVPASVVPVINSVTPTRVDGTVPSAWGKYVKGKSKLKLDVSASGIYGSTITAAAIYERVSGVDTLVTNMTLSGSVWTGTTPYLASSGAKTYVVKVTDSRGRKAENSGTAITVYDYYLPSISGVIIQRCLSNGTPDTSGTYIGVYAEFAYASVGGSNTAAGTVQYRQMPSGSWSSAQTLTNETLKVIGGGSIDITKSYQVYIAYADAFYTAEYTDDVGTAECLVNAVGDTKLAVFGYAENDGFEVKGDKEIRYKGVTLDSRFEKKSDNTAAAIVDKLETVPADARAAIGIDGWTDYSPSTSGITVGDGTLTARYSTIGKLLMVTIEFTLGSTSAVSGNPIFSLPSGCTVKATAYGVCKLTDSGGLTYTGLWIANKNETTVQVRDVYANQTFTYMGNASSTTPFTWASGDSIAIAAYIPIA